MMNRRFQTNEKIGDYRVLEFIGRGGMGEVYHFYHEKLNRSVAVKVLGENVVSDENYKARFLNEARLQASLQHPNIAALYDFQEVAGELLIFMEFVDGESLDGLIERNFFSIEETLKVFEEIVEAIRYVHASGIIHRDIKTENVKINSGGVPKLLDFGIAKAPSSLSLTQVGGVVGTPNYLAPEQIEGREASAQTDVWALGVLLYKMLTGRFPFDGERLESLIFQISQAEYDAPENFNPAVPKAVSRIVKKCLSRDLSRRYQSAEELLLDVRRVLNERYSGENFAAKDSLRKSLPIGKISAVAGLVLLIFGLIVTGIWATGGTAEKAEIKTPLKKETVENQPKNAAPERKNVPPAALNAVEKNKRTIRIDTVGGSAEVWRGEQKIGATPLDLEVAEKEIVNLKLRRAGFEDNDVQIEASAGKKVYTFALTAK
jgi:eukaryotic-like serine/threonine-protein kinase